MKKAQSGFTLLELMLVVTLAGLLLAFGVPAMGNFFRNARITGAANYVMAALHFARSEAIKRRVPVTLCTSADPLNANPVCDVSALLTGWVAVSGLSADQRALVRNRKFGFVFQNFNLLPRTSALDNVAMPLTYTAGHLSERQARNQAREVLAQVGLVDRLEHEPSQLSGGQQQRVAIARALVNHPPVMFADEPTGNLDSRTSAEVLRMFQQLNDQNSITIIIVTHDALVAKHAQRIIRIHDGLIVEGSYGAAAEAVPVTTGLGGAL